MQLSSNANIRAAFVAGETQPDFGRFKGIYRNAAIIVCGCGNSLHALQPPPGVPTIGVNDVGRLFTPDYLVVVNPRRQFPAERFRHIEQSGARALFTHLDLGPVLPPVARFRLGRYGGTDEGEGDVLHYTQNSPYVAVCLAAYMGAARIGLIGVDFNEDHFFGRTGRHPLTSRLAQIDREYGALARALAQRGIALVNLSACSRLTSLDKMEPARWLGDEAGPVPALQDAPPAVRSDSLRIVSYATTPVAGVPAVLARCIEHATAHTAHCVWAGGSYGNGVAFEGGISWSKRPDEALAILEAADVVILHNGKIAPAHRALLRRKQVVTMAHNYGWNVEMQHVRAGYPGVVVGQYQATLPEFAGWGIVPNPVPLWEPEFGVGDKSGIVHIAYTPSGRHERYPPGHRLYWHGKGFETTMAVLQRLARQAGVCIETTAHAQVSHAQALAMKRRAHIVIDECVTGSYHRNSLEGLAAGAVVINGVGLLPGVEQVLRHLAPDSTRLPFVFSTLDTLERTLLELIERGPAELATMGRRNREWMERHWGFEQQWQRFWAGPCAARATGAGKEKVMGSNGTAKVSVIVPHAGPERLQHLAASLATLRQRSGIHEVIVVELGRVPVARELARQWADKHLFVAHEGPFERARAFNAAQAVAEGELLLWHDGDILIPPEFVPRATQELLQGRLDYLVPYTWVRYLSAADSARVIQGAADPADCVHDTALHSGTGASGGIGLVRRDFLQRHGGFVEGFIGWGGEDNAWMHKVRLLGRVASTRRNDQNVYHLFHNGTNGNQLGAAAHANPYYTANLALLDKVWAVRDATTLGRRFPAATPTPGELSCWSAREGSAPRLLPVWCYWEGPQPAWIRACLRTIAAAAPNVQLLDADSFAQLRDRDRDIDLSRLSVAQRADYIRAFLLQRFGGLWIDADCIVMKPLAPVLDALAEADFIGHRERSGLVSNGFIGARSGSHIAARFYARICAELRARRSLGWTSLGSKPLTEVVCENAENWHELPCERVQPICWSEAHRFFEQRSATEHERSLDRDALCYMLSNSRILDYLHQHPGEELMTPGSFFSFLLEHAPCGPDLSSASTHEPIFREHSQLCRRHRSESVSGPGSSMEQTREIRERLPLTLAHLGVHSLLDLPCGDFNWMRHVQLGSLDYVGVDVQRDLAALNQAVHGDSRRRFVRADILHDALPAAEAILCRDLLPHLSYAEIATALRNFKRSGATWLITTTFTGPRCNHDTTGGQWRTLSLHLPPFNFPPPLLAITEKCSEGGGAYDDKSLAVWRLMDLPIDELSV
jgi:hypothetical protein